MHVRSKKPSVEKQLTRVKEELVRVTGEKNAFLDQCRENPNGFEAKAKKVLYKKFHNQIAELHRRAKKLGGELN